ncbi:response regulator transcription factor [Paenalcaligenes niemegkensis]|uniref:response regulator transcription factor n=1 Tax=Paenalcaligenes niemegkensis TaxID=2895469 RepID=UPI001EE87656|nr:response regulator transcription factor [Paenalcaligenes niemegkensis]MCQ9616506.1 response regulator transcription factor [Paenalcaligenes niemegkensis]
MRILIVEDNLELGSAIHSRLRQTGHSTEWVTNGTEAIRYAMSDDWDAILLDIMLPDRDGFAIIAKLRNNDNHVPVLVMTARAEIEDRVSMLDLGADDYLVKPFDLRELEARLRALMRRPTGQITSVVQIGNLSMDVAGRRITIDQHTIDFGPREFCLIEILLARLNQVVSKERLMVQLFNFDESATPNAIELHISRIRRKLNGASIEIETVRGTGYRALFAGSTS